MKNNSVMKCCICNNKKSGEFITIDNKKYHLCCIEQLKDNWNKLKEFLVEKQKQGLSVISADYILYIMIEIERGESDE